MRTKLEAIAGYLAGRAEGPSDLAEELLDPESEASRFLAETRRKSRALVEEPAAPSHPIAPRPSSTWRPAGLLVVVVIATAALATWIVERRFQRLEGQINQTQGQALHRLDQVETRMTEAHPAPARDPGVETMLKAVEVSIDRLESRLGPRPPAIAPPAPAQGAPASDPALAEIRAEVAAVRREVMASESANARQIQELRTILQEVRRILSSPRAQSQSQPASPPAPQPVAVSPALQVLVNNLTSPIAQVRLEAIQQVARLGPGGRGALPALQQLLNREADPRVRAAAAEAAIAISREE